MLPNKNSIRGIAAVIMLSLMPTARGQVVASRDKSFALVHELLKAAYPDLVKDGRFLKLSTGQNFADGWVEIHGITFEVTRFEQAETNPPHDARTGKLVPVVPNETLLQGGVHFNDDGEIDEMFAGESEFVNWARNFGVKQLIESHPEWSNDEDYAQLKHAGALYGPNDRDRFVKSLHFERYTGVFGPIKVVSISFNGLDSDRGGEFGHVSWTVEGEAGGLAGHPRYFFNFEPFDGKLTSLIRAQTPANPGPALH